MQDVCPARPSPQRALELWLAWVRLHGGATSKISFVRTRSGLSIQIVTDKGHAPEMEAFFRLALMEARDEAPGAVRKCVPLHRLDGDAIERLFEVVGPLESMLLERVEFSTVEEPSGHRFEALFVGRPDSTVSAIALREHIESAVEALEDLVVV